MIEALVLSRIKEFLFGAVALREVSQQASVAELRLTVAAAQHAAELPSIPDKMQTDKSLGSPCKLHGLEG